MLPNTILYTRRVFVRLGRKTPDWMIREAKSLKGRYYSIEWENSIPNPHSLIRILILLWLYEVESRKKVMVPVLHCTRGERSSSLQP